MAVWDGAAQVGDEGGEAAAAQAQHVGGRNIVRHDDQGFVAVHMTHVRQHGGCAGQHVQHAFNDLAHVGAALAQVLVFHGVELLAQDLALRGQRPFGVVVPLGDQRQRLLGQQRVAQQQAVDVEHGAQLARASAGRVSASSNSSCCASASAWVRRLLSAAMSSGAMR